MNVIKTGDFDSAFKNLPKGIQRLFNTQIERFILNWHDSRVHIKKVRILEGVFSLRITRRYRAFLYFQNPENAVFFDIDHRKDIYR